MSAKVLIERVRPLSEAVVTQQSRFRQALGEQNLAEAKLLLACVAELGGALGALCSGYVRYLPDGGQEHYRSVKVAPGLELCANGTWLLDGKAATVSEVLAGHALWDIVASLVRALEAQLSGKLGKRTEQIERSARKLQAVCDLLGE